MSDSLQPPDCILWNSPGRNTGVDSLSLLQGIFPTQIKPRSLTLQVDSLPVEPQGKPKNTGVGSLSLLQRIFLTQQLNWGLLLCKWILYQLSYQGSPLALMHCLENMQYIGKAQVQAQKISVTDKMCFLQCSECSDTSVCHLKLFCASGMAVDGGNKGRLY